MKNNKILITGVAGFIGFSLARSFLNNGVPVSGIDNINNYYSQKLKKDRIKILKKYKIFSFYKKDLRNKKNLTKIFEKNNFSFVYHLAAQAGVRHSIKKPDDYLTNNLVGFFNLLDVCRINKVKHFIFASTSSVYGYNKKLPFEEKDPVNHPSQFYAATKRSNELIAHSYSHLFKLPTTGLRFFTVYGPWGRPDMATYIFTKKILEKKKIDIYNHGRMKRDFTYIDDIVKGICGAVNSKIGKKKFHKIYNLGNNKSEKLMDFIKTIEKHLGIISDKNFLPLQPGDVKETYAEISESKKDLNFYPNTTIKDGIPKFIKWYKEYYRL